MINWKDSASIVPPRPQNKRHNTLEQIKSWRIMDKRRSLSAVARDADEQKVVVMRFHRYVKAWVRHLKACDPEHRKLFGRDVENPFTNLEADFDSASDQIIGWIAASDVKGRPAALNSVIRFIVERAADDVKN